MFCREHTVQLHREIERIHRAGGELVVIGSGAPHFIKGFRETTKFDGPIYCDPSLKVYEAAHLQRGVWRVFHPLVAVYGARALAGGFMQGKQQGDNYQQGGVYVILPGGQVAYVHISQRAGDNAPAVEVVTALEQAVNQPAA